MKNKIIKLLVVLAFVSTQSRVPHSQLDELIQAVPVLPHHFIPNPPALPIIYQSGYFGDSEISASFNGYQMRICVPPMQNMQPLPEGSYWMTEGDLVNQIFDLVSHSRAQNRSSTLGLDENWCSISVSLWIAEGLTVDQSLRELTIEMRIPLDSPQMTSELWESLCALSDPEQPISETSYGDSDNESLGDTSSAWASHEAREAVVRPIHRSDLLELLRYMVGVLFSQNT